MTKQWTKSMTKGSYISADGKYTAELRAAGYYAEFGCKLTRHYAVRLRGQSNIVATAKTLKDAEAYL